MSILEKKVLKTTDLSFYLKKPEKDMDIKSRVNTRKETIKARVKSMKEKREKINKSKQWFFQISKTNVKCWTNQHKKKKTQINSVRNERGNIVTDSIDINNRILQII